MQDNLLRVHRFEPASRANGPGLRAVLWVQGCPLACPGCFNPETHLMSGGETWTVEQALSCIKECRDLEGLTISGGEPVLQHAALARLLEHFRRETGLSVLVFTGYYRRELDQFPGIERFLDGIDVLIAGRYETSQRLARGLIGSANKEVHLLTGRYKAADLDDVPQGEILISPGGEIILSGIDPLHW